MNQLYKLQMEHPLWKENILFSAGFVCNFIVWSVCILSVLTENVLSPFLLVGFFCLFSVSFSWDLNRYILVYVSFLFFCWCPFTELFTMAAFHYTSEQKQWQKQWNRACFSLCYCCFCVVFCFPLHSLMQVFYLYLFQYIFVCLCYVGTHFSCYLKFSQLGTLFVIGLFFFADSFWFSLYLCVLFCTVCTIYVCGVCCHGNSMAVGMSAMLLS